jgi:type II secretory pathway pseudopilin PulG
MSFFARTQNRIKGFTLVEALFSLAMVGVLIICMYSAFSSGFGGVQNEREDARATQILVTKMEQMRLLNWDQVTTNGFPDEFTENFNPEVPVAGSSKGKTKGKGKGKSMDPLVYYGEIKVRKGPNDVSYQDDLRQIEISVEWETPNGRRRERNVTTYVARYGLQNYVY